MTIYSKYKKIARPHHNLTKPLSEKGFTLIEVIIVIGIIGILAAIAIPNYTRFQLRSKTAEAEAIIEGIKTGQLAYQADNNGYVPCASSPGASGTAGVSKRPWIDNGGFASIGFRPTGDVYYNYSVAVGPNVGGVAAGEMAIEAEGDLDGDTAPSYYTLNTDGAMAGASSGAVPPVAWDTFQSGDDY